MRLNFITLALSLAFAGISSAIPTSDASLNTFISKRTVSPDNSCGAANGGANNNYTCDATANTGGCCSQYGFCGNTTGICGVGCQSKFGTCGGGTSTETCGPNFGNAVCSGNQCCSMIGYCGTTSDYCADPGSCMLGFGRCDSDSTPAGPSTENAPRPLKGPITYTDDIYDCVQDKVVALTYDDGPYLYTAQLLDTLKSYGFQATFFMTGNNNGKGQIDTTAPYPDLIKRMISEGHQVASHTWSHYSLSNSSHALRISQMVKNEMAINNIIGKWPTYMRPPYSDCTKASGCWADMQSLGYHRVYFDLDTQDYLNPSPNQIQNSKNIVKQKLEVSGVTDYLSIQHDIVQQSVTNLTSYYFDLIKAKGWKGVTVGDCLGDTDRTNWYRTLDGSSSSTSSSSSSSTSSVSSSVSSPTSMRTSTASSVTTSKPATSTSSTSSTSSTTSKPSTSPSSTKAPTTSPAPQPTSTKTTSTSSQKPTPTPPICILSNGRWCGTIDPFMEKVGCNKAVADCYGESSKCVAANWLNIGTCLQWNTVCTKLSAYCLKCIWGSCSNTGAGY